MTGPDAPLPEAVREQREALYHTVWEQLTTGSAITFASQLDRLISATWESAIQQERARLQGPVELLKRIYDHALFADNEVTEYWHRLILDAVCPLSPVTEADIEWARQVLAESGRGASSTPPPPEEER